MSQFLTLGANGNTLKFRVFVVVRVYYDKLGHMLKLLVPKFRPDLFARLRDRAEKQMPAKLKPIVGAYCTFPPRNCVILLRGGRKSLPTNVFFFFNKYAEAVLSRES